MKISEYRHIFKIEDRYFYYVANHNLILSFIEIYLSHRKKKLKILDAGCGTGLLAKKLEKYGDVSAIDISNEAVGFSLKRKVKAQRASVEKIPFKDKIFDLVVSLDVIYHMRVENDKKALSEFFRILKPKGFLIIRVPAYPWLKKSTDTHVYTRERYDIFDLKAKIESVGFLIRKITFVNLTVLPSSIFQYLLDKILPPKKSASPARDVPPIVNFILIKLLSFEIAMIKRINLPFGLGIFVVGQKP